MLIHNFLENSARRLPEKIALICGRRRLTYRQVDELSTRLAEGLLSLGVKRHDRVVLYLDNSVEAVVSLYAVMKAGAAFVLLNPGMKALKLGFIIRDSGARVIVANYNRRLIVAEALRSAECLEHVIWCNGDEEAGNRAGELHPGPVSLMSWNALMNSIGPYGSGRLPKIIDVDIATIIYTSGSTGEPKGVISAHCNMVAAASSITTYLRNVPDDIILNTLPLSFDYGLYQILMAALFGGTVVLEKSFSFPYEIIERLVQERVTGFPLVPTMVAILLRMEDLSKFDFSALRYMTNTAAVLPVPHIKRLRSLFPKVSLFSMYGLTECKRVAYLPPEEIDRKPSSVGIPIPNEEVFIVDAEGNEVSSGEVGELVVRGSNVMQGYWNRAEETARTFRPGRHRGDTLLYTGDLFKKDADGFLYFVARKDDMIKTKGERVSPKEIENAVCSMPGVVEAAVIGVPDELLGQAIKVFIVPDGKGSLAALDVQRHCSRNLEPHMVPKYVEFISMLKRDQNGKVDKKLLSGNPGSTNELL